MENFTRVSDSIRKDTSLNASEKLFIGFLETYQSTPDNYSTKNYCFLKQEELAKELGESLSTIKRIIVSLISKGIIFQSQARNYNKTGYQFKNRKATILVDENNPLPTPIDIKKKAPKEVKLKSEVVTPEVIIEVPQSMFGEQRDIFQELEEYNSEADYEPLIKDTYSNITFKGFLIKEKHLGVWDLIQGYKGVMNKLNNYFRQIDFDIEMDKNYESYKDRVIQIN